LEINILVFYCQNVSCDNATTCIQNSYYPPQSIPAVAFGNVLGNSNSELIFSFDDGRVVCYDYTGTLQWQFSFASDNGINNQQYYIGSSEVAIVDLDQNGMAEVIFTTYGFPLSTMANQHLYILNGQTGAVLQKVNMNSAATNPNGDDCTNSNGCGFPGGPTVDDIDGDGQLEILTHSFDGRLVIFTVPGSKTNCMLWPTSRGGYLRKGQNDAGVY